MKNMQWSPLGDYHCPQMEYTFFKKSSCSIILFNTKAVWQPKRPHEKARAVLCTWPCSRLLLHHEMSPWYFRAAHLPCSLLHESGLSGRHVYIKQETELTSEPIRRGLVRKLQAAFASMSVEPCELLRRHSQDRACGIKCASYTQGRPWLCASTLTTCQCVMVTRHELERGSCRTGVTMWFFSTL